MIYKIIYIFISAFIGFTCSISGIHTNNWRFWVFIIGAGISYICGVLSANSKSKNH